MLRNLLDKSSLYLKKPVKKCTHKRRKKNQSTCISLMRVKKTEKKIVNFFLLHKISGRKVKAEQNNKEQIKKSVIKPQRNYAFDFKTTKII